jgi:hypothetical protein
MIDVHAEKIDIKLLCPREILHIKHDVVDTGNLKR